MEQPTHSRRIRLASVQASAASDDVTPEVIRRRHLTLVEPHKPDLYASLEPEREDELIRDWPWILLGAAFGLLWIGIFFVTRWAQ
jgi:hypothetical protein